LGFDYASKTGGPMGITNITLKRSAVKTKIAVKGRGAGLGGMNLLPARVPVHVQLRAENGACWSASFADPAVLNDGRKLKLHTAP
jgi:hypothetical protein